MAFVSYPLFDNMLFPEFESPTVFICAPPSPRASGHTHSKEATKHPTPRGKRQACGPVHAIKPKLQPQSSGKVRTLPIDVYERADEYEIVADAPGLAHKDLAVQLADNKLTISGQSNGSAKAREGDKVLRSERNSFQFCRIISLPEDANTDSIRAKLDSGVLSVTIAKQPAKQPFLIPVEGVETPRTFTAQTKAVATNAIVDPGAEVIHEEAHADVATEDEEVDGQVEDVSNEDEEEQ